MIKLVLYGNLADNPDKVQRQRAITLTASGKVLESDSNSEGWTGYAATKKYIHDMFYKNSGKCN